MSADPQYDGIITLEPRLDVAVLAPPEAPPVVELPPPSAPVPVPTARHPRPGWLVPAAIAAIGLIASGMLGYLFYTTNTKLQVTTQTLAATKVQLTNLQADAASKKQVADYLSMYTIDSGTVQTDYQQVVACSSFSTCRTSAQQALSDMQRFQSDRQSAKVPAGLSASDSQLGDSLSAGIAALQQLISGMDTDDVKKVDAGFKSLDAAMLGVAKAESALGSELR
jgi:hypothetical protein